jgi:hypothetical protein
MHCDHDLTLAALFMLVSVKAATVLGQPSPKCGAFHRLFPCIKFLIASSLARLHWKHGHYAKFSDASLICVKQPSDRSRPKAVVQEATINVRLSG